MEAFDEDGFHFRSGAVAGEEAGDGGKGPEAFAQQLGDPDGFGFENLGDAGEVAGEAGDEFFADFVDFAFDLFDEAALGVDVAGLILDAILDGAEGGGGLAAPGFQGFPAGGGLADAFGDEVLEGRVAAGFQAVPGEGRGAFCFIGEFAGNGEDWRHMADAFHRQVRHVAEDDFDVVGVALVGLLDDECDAFERIDRGGAR